MEADLRTCDVCNTPKNRDGFNNINGKWVCGDCEHANFKSKYEPILEIHNSENAFIVENYPYGFTAKTKKKYWIETTKIGDRLITQTLNPKTEKWNAEKKSTYSDVGILTKEKSTGYINWHSWGSSYTQIEDLNKFLDFIGNFQLNEQQQQKVKEGKAIYRTREHIKVKCVNVTNETKAQTEIREAEQEKVKHELALIHNHYRKEEGAI